MGSRLRPWMAALVSVLVHLAVALFVFGHASRPASVKGGAGQVAPALTVRLVAPPRPSAAAAPPVPAPEPAAVAATSIPAAPVAAETSSSQAAEPHYFTANEVTESPVVDVGMADGKLLIVPGIKAQAVSLEVWINEEGVVERIALESPMAESEQELLTAAFANVRFLPGRIGHLAVRSRLAMRVLLDDAFRL